MVVTYCRPGELFQSMREDLIRPMQNTKLRRHDRPEKSDLPLDHQSGCSPGGGPSLRYEDFTKESRRATRALGLYCSVSVPPFWSVAGQSGTTPHNVGHQKKTAKVEIRQQHCPLRKIWKIGADSVRSHQKPTHRLSSRGAHLWETPSRGRFTTLADGGRLFLNLFSNDRVSRAAQKLGERVAVWMW